MSHGRQQRRVLSHPQFGEPQGKAVPSASCRAHKESYPTPDRLPRRNRREDASDPRLGLSVCSALRKGQAKTLAEGTPRSPKRSVVLDHRLGHKWVVALTALYGMRVEIEEFFRDAKSVRNGFALRHTQAATVDRFDRLLLTPLLAIS